MSNSKKFPLGLHIYEVIFFDGLCPYTSYVVGTKVKDIRNEIAEASKSSDYTLYSKKVGPNDPDALSISQSFEAMPAFEGIYRPIWISDHLASLLEQEWEQQGFAEFLYSQHSEGLGVLGYHDNYSSSWSGYMDAVMENDALLVHSKRSDTGRGLLLNQCQLLIETSLYGIKRGNPSVNVYIVRARNWIVRTELERHNKYSKITHEFEGLLTEAIPIWRSLPMPFDTDYDHFNIDYILLLRRLLFENPEMHARVIKRAREILTSHCEASQKSYRSFYRQSMPEIKNNRDLDFWLHKAIDDIVPTDIIHGVDTHAAPNPLFIEKLSVIDAAAEIKVRPSSIRQAIRRKNLKARKDGRDWRITKFDLMQYKDTFHRDKKSL